MTDDTEQGHPPRSESSRRVASTEKKSKSEFFRLLGIASTVGINLVISTFIGFAIGYYLLDRFFKTFPWFTIIFLLLGIVAGFKYLFKVASKASDNDEKSKFKNQK